MLPTTGEGVGEGCVAELRDKSSLYVARASLESSLLTLFGGLFAIALTIFFVFYCVKRYRERRRSQRVCLAPMRKTSMVKIESINVEKGLSKSLNIIDI